MGTESRDECTQPGNCQDQDKGHFNGTVTECHTNTGFGPSEPHGQCSGLSMGNKEHPGEGSVFFPDQESSQTPAHAHSQALAPAAQQAGGLGT